MDVSDERPRIPVRAAFAFAGGGSLGTFLAGAGRTILIAIRGHNAALLAKAPASDPRYINDRWGRITVDAIAGSSAGALCSGQMLRSLLDPGYLATGAAITKPRTFTGDWIHGGDFSRLSVEGNQATSKGPVDAPGWTLISGANLFQLAQTALDMEVSRPDPVSPVDPDGLVGIGITLTDLLGFQEHAEFPASSVLGHPSFGAPLESGARVAGLRGRPIQDLGGLGHAEVRRMFIATTAKGAAGAEAFLNQTHRQARACTMTWSPTTVDRLAAMAAASAALPLAVGPLAVEDTGPGHDGKVRRLYMDGGILNNKPVSPALKLARWHDGVRIAQLRDAETGLFDLDALESELQYERVCFFVDAFPVRANEEWRSPNPNLPPTGSRRLSEEAVAEREFHINQAFSSPPKALSTLYGAMMSSLRAQDMVGIARTNHRLITRDSYIDDRIRNVGFKQDLEVDFPIDSIDRALAYAAVLSRPGASELTAAQRRYVARRVWESDRFSGLQGRRRITLVPVFAPENSVEAFAGEALYAMGGLFSYEARKHDARVGSLVAAEVVKALAGTPAESSPVNLRPAPEEAIPDDTQELTERLFVAGQVTVDSFQSTATVLGFLAKLPLFIGLIANTVKRWLDRQVTGTEE